MCANQAHHGFTAVLRVATNTLNSLVQHSKEHYGIESARHELEDSRLDVSAAYIINNDGSELLRKHLQTICSFVDADYEEALAQFVQVRD